MEESAVANTNKTTLTKRMRALAADLTAVPLLQAMLDQLRGELAAVRIALDSERSTVRALKRDRAAEIKSVREEEARKCRDALNDLKSRLERDHEDALQHQKDAVTKSLNAEMLRALKAKDSEMRQELTQAHAREETLKSQVRDAVRASCGARSQKQASDNSNTEIQKLQHEVSTLRSQNKQLEERLQVAIAADRQKATDLRSQHEEHELELTSIKKHSQQEAHRLLEELKSKDRLISQLEKRLSLQTGRMEEQRERVLESFENRNNTSMERRTERPRTRAQRQSGEITEPMSEKEEFHDTLYSCILKEHLELLCEHQPLQSKMKREMAQRILLEHELAATRTKVRELKRMLMEQKSGSALMAERIASLQAEAHELREQNELLEFRILELEECHENASVKSHSPDTRTDTESDSGIQSLPNSDDVTSDTDLGIYDINIGRSLQNLPESSISSNESSKISSRIIAKVLPFTDLSADIGNETDESFTDGYNTLKKKLKNTECMQESGIFEEAEFNTQSTQTDDILEIIEETGVSEFMLENGVVGDLSAEIKKLTQFRELIEERGNCCDRNTFLRINGEKVDIPQSVCSHIKELQYYKERLQILEDKILVYESSGETQTRLLANRLQKEVSLSAQVKELTTRVHNLSNLNRHLEEEKCEFEEAENDTRLKCQKLEVKIIALNEKKSDLQTLLQQERRNMSRLRTSLCESERKRLEIKGQLNYIETVLNTYEHRNYELEEHEVELRHRLEMLENIMPVLLMWNLWHMILSTTTNATPRTFIKAIKENIREENCYSEQYDPLYKCMVMAPCDLANSVCSFKQISLTDCKSPSSSEDILMNLKEVEKDKNRILHEKEQTEEICKEIEKQLKENLQLLESKEALITAQLQKYRETEEFYKKEIEKLEKEIFSKNEMSSETIKKEIFPKTCDKMTNTSIEDMVISVKSCENHECMEKIQALVQTELDMKKQISELELKERAYMETLQQADELWSEMENSYKARLAKAEDNEASLREKIRKLEERETKLQQTFRYEDENYVLMEKIQNFEHNEKQFKERVHILETEKNKLFNETKQLRDTLVLAQNELKNTKEGPLKEELIKERKLSKTLKEEIKIMENEMEEISSAHDTQISGMKAQLAKMSRELIDMECTNSELKEEVETLEASICELKSSLELQKANEEKMLIQMSQTILEKEKELEATKQEIEYAKTPSAHEELKEALPELQKQQTVTKSFPERPQCQKQCVKDCTCSDSQVTLLPSTLSQKPVLRRWLHQEKEWRQW